MATLKVDGATLHYDVHGEGPPVVFVHGTGTHRLVFGPSVAKLPAAHALVMYDRRGFGASSGPLARRLSEHTDDLAALVQHLGGGPATIVAISGGAVVALDLAARAPELVEQLVLAEPAVHLAWTPSMSAMGALAALFLRLRLRRDPVAAVVGFYRWASSRRDGTNGYDPLPEEWRRIAIGHARAVFRELAQMLFPYPSARSIRTIRCPVTMIIGDVGVPVFHRTTRRTARILGHAVTAPVTDTGHLIPTDQPDAFADIVATCLRHEGTADATGA